MHVVLDLPVRVSRLASGRSVAICHVCVTGLLLKASVKLIPREFLQIPDSLGVWLGMQISLKTMRGFKKQPR